MIANQINLNRFLSQADTQFIIPVYQRNYDWTETQCKLLLDDILAAGLNDKIVAHFIGSIVYIHDGEYLASGIRELAIIDGQQRLTTITLAYICIYRLLLKIGDQSQVNRVHETYLINKFAADEEKLKLRPTENNDKALKHILLEDTPEDYPNGFSRVISNYNYFKSRITEENYGCVLKGLAKLMFVEISLERGKDDAQRIFESLNSTGLELSQADLIRNYILMGLSRTKQDEIYRHYWEKIETLAKDEATNSSRVSDFIRDYLTLQNRKIPNKNLVYQEFKTKYPGLAVPDLENLLTKLRNLARNYQKLINPARESDPQIRRHLEYIHQLEINVCYPFLIQVYEDYQNQLIDKAVFVSVLELIQAFAWRRFILGLQTNALNKIFMRLYDDVVPSDYLASIQKSLLRKKGSQRFPKDAEVLQSLAEKDLYNIKPKNRIYFLERLENHQNNEPVRFDSDSGITIEHIFPQNPDPQWRTDLPALSFQKFADVCLHTIGNLTLSGNNGSLGNRPFLAKKTMNVDGKEQGYQFSRLWLNRLLKEIDTWDVEQYDQRTTLLGQRFLAIWRYPDVSMDDSQDLDEINIFDIEDSTGKKLEYVIFQDQKMEMHTVSDLYLLVLRTLFQANPDPFFATDLVEKLKITKHSSTCRSPAALNETYFIEANIANQTKLERLKIALSVYDAEDDLIIKFRP
ncbi:MAG: DUF262 domain-containing protein [Verrucomicrobiota bacterium]